MSHDLAPPARRSLAIGTFDGVHLGHRAVIEAAICSAESRELRSAVVTFHPHPMAVIRPELAPPELGRDVGGELDHGAARAGHAGPKDRACRRNPAG